MACSPGTAGSPPPSNPNPNPNPNPDPNLNPNPNPNPDPDPNPNPNPNPDPHTDPNPTQVTTFMHLGPLVHVDRAALHVLLLEYGGVKQRYGT